MATLSTRVQTMFGAYSPIYLGYTYVRVQQKNTLREVLVPPYPLKKSVITFCSDMEIPMYHEAKSRGGNGSERFDPNLTVADHRFYLEYGLTLMRKPK